jgi:secreted trypsin-like serine protease
VKLVKLLCCLGFLFECAGCGSSNSPSGNLSEVGTEYSAGIIGGKLVTAEDAVAPFVVGLYDEAHKSKCTGSILSENLILTAAHCVVPGSSRILVVFDRNLFEGSRPNRSRSVVADSFLRHPQFRQDRMAGEDTYDLALIRFSGGLPSGYRKVELSSDFEKSLGSKTEFLASGFGVSSGAFNTGSGILRWTVVPFLQLHAKTEFQTSQSSSGVCSGDSGGPLFQMLDGRLVQVGVASRVSNRSLFCGGFAVFTRIDIYRSWLEQALSL